jgi:hypothetical protein
MKNELNPTILESIQNDVAQVGDSLRVIAQRVIEEGISEYPVFVAAQEWVDVGKPIFDRDAVQLNWFFSASILEDFVRKNLVKADRVKDFQRAFGDPSERACIFVITPDVQQFIFVPYDVDAIEAHPNGNGQL